MMRGNWRWWVVVALSLEKTVQHIFVTLAFAGDWQGIRATVVVNPDWLMVAGGIIALLFALSLWAVITRKVWAFDLLAALALGDIVGEFYAQGTLAIQVPISFVVAMLLLFVVLAWRRRWRAAANGLPPSHSPN